MEQNDRQTKPTVDYEALLNAKLMMIGKSGPAVDSVAKETGQNSPSDFGSPAVFPGAVAATPEGESTSTKERMEDSRKSAADVENSLFAKDSGSLRNAATDMSLGKVAYKYTKLAKLMNNILKFCLIIPPVVLGFPWLYGAAYVIERKEEVDYSWNEVAWRVFGAFSFSVNAAIIFGSLHAAGMKDALTKHLKYVNFFCGYCACMTFLCAAQAFWGRYFEEKEPGGGAKATKYFWRKSLLILGIQLNKRDKAVDTSWIWSFSLISVVFGVLCLSMYDIIDERNSLPVTGECGAPRNTTLGCDVNMVSADINDKPYCCNITINPVSVLEYATTAGGVFFFYYAIFKVFGLFFVWAENTTLPDEEASRTYKPSVTKELSGN